MLSLRCPKSYKRHTLYIYQCELQSENKNECPHLIGNFRKDPYIRPDQSEQH